MATEKDRTAQEPEAGSTPSRNLWPRRILIGLGSVLGILVLVIGAGLLWLNSESGRRFAAKQIESMQFANGMQIDMGRIDGSLYGAMRVHDLVFRDPQGVFFTAPIVEMDWRPFAFINNHVDIRSLAIPKARLLRLPTFKQTPSDPDAPLLPDIDIDVGSLKIGQFLIEPPVTGKRHAIALNGKAHIADGRAVVDADTRAMAGPNIAGGDRMTLRLNAVPDDNKLDLALDIAAPANGLVAALSGIGQPMRLTLKGKGDWERWNGTLTGNSGGRPLSDITLSGRDGTFAAKGSMRPGLLLPGPAGNLLRPVTQVDLRTTAQDRRFDVDGSIENENFALSAYGIADLGANSMRDLAIGFQLKKPNALAENLVGAGISAGITMNGKMAAPRIDYRINAARIGFDKTVIQGLQANGSAQLRKDRWMIPVNARARAITGLNAAAGSLLTNVRINGDLAYANSKILSDNLRLRSDRIDATAIVLADLSSGLYTGGLKGRVNDYSIDGVGTFNVVTDIDLDTPKPDTYRLAGTVRAKSSRIYSDGVRNFLGGNSLIVADVSYSTDGIARVSRLNIAAPAFRLTSGSGTYRTNGAIQFTARGTSNQYGPLGLDVSGTADRPVVKLAAPRPGVGIGLADLVATVRGTPRGYAVAATSTSDYGPLKADVDLIMGRGPMLIQVNDGSSFAGVGLTGQLRQTAAGPFDGRLVANGSGIEGTVQLSSLRGSQRAVVDATALDARLPGSANISIGRAIVDADVILYDQPQITADVQLERARTRKLFIAAARAKVDYRSGSGTAKLMVEGRNTFPFRLAANSILRPDLWRIALDGRANGIDFKTRNPMRIIPTNGTYRLMSTTIDLSNGAVQLAGDYGDGMNIQTRLNDVDLALFNPIMPGLGLGGSATGSLDFAQPTANAFPHADARLRIDDFTRTSLASVSQPVDIHLVGRLLPDGGNARAIIRRRGAAIGRMHVNLRPLPPGAGSWTTRLMAAPLSGGIRYNGPADTLFSLAALPDQSLKGPVGVAADFSGRVQRPQLSGIVRANTLVYENHAYGTRLTNMQVRGSFTGDRLNVEQLTARAGDGTISGSGFVSLSSDQGFPVQLALDLDHARLANSTDIAAVASGKISVINNPGQPATISGRISLPETRYKIVREGSAKVATLTGIRRKPAIGRARITGDADAMTSLPNDWKLDVDVIADNQIHVSGMGLNSEWAADIHIGGTTGNPSITGGIKLVRGTLGFAGRSFDLQEGRLQFNGGVVTNPSIRLVASGEADDVTVNVIVGGTGDNPEITFSSTPGLPQDEIVSRILFGNSIGELSAIQAVQLAASLNSLRGGSGGLNPLGVLQQSAGIDRLRILGADEDTGRGTAVAAGQYISNDVYVEIVTDARGYTATQLEISLTKALSVLSQVGSFGGSNINLRYRKDY
ncbi:translocation/assembly module TamB domain-containing protein [Rhizorhapis sp. SPR117]|uniref:translocation/assembly module TamB domain-containing protein n=1 Tax=Rhizorhapis sp. SPR117 TaxID=2912611 RepID=UPI001F021CD2|nr:translocation/assembly module TamB domain-containing protein [Rhizorhapis sp. SPR117]